MEYCELLVEIGCEEIPAGLLEGTAKQFADKLAQGLAEQRLASSRSVLWFTPRRIIAGFRDIPARQDDLYETIVGPPKKVAYDAEGKPTRAAEAFAQKNGAKIRDLKTTVTPKGEYVSVVRRTRGKKTHEILETLVPAAIGGIQFPKTMHWSEDGFRFTRPIRWIVALFEGRVVRFPLADVKSSDRTSGHRFLGKARIRVSSAESLRESLLRNGVVVDPAVRRLKIEQGLERGAGACGGILWADPELLETVVNLNEFPSVIAGAFETRFLSLPKEILVTVMREHQKYFSVVDATGNLLPVFLAVVNLESDDMGKIRAGHERVLRARLADAAFFWETDRKKPLATREESLKNVTFQEKLGSYYDKTRRILKLLPRVAETMGCAEQLHALETAGHMLKCDLVTEMVKEFTDLQGIVGGLYAQAEGYPEPVWRAISEQYMPKTTSSPSPSTASSAVLALIDRLDSVCGCFSVGLIPTGSKDPLAVRRQGNGVLKILLDHRIPVSLGRLVDWSLETYGVAAAEKRHELLSFFEGRLRFLLEEAGYAYDAMNAALAVGFDDPLDAFERVKALQQMRSEPDFLSVASNFKRIVNILQQAGDVAGDPDPGRMTDTAEVGLWQSFLEVLPRVEAARSSHDYPAALRALASMRRVVDEFFDKVLVMAEDPAVRANRLALLRRISGMFLGIADISQMVLT